MPDQPEQAEQPEQAILALSVGELIRAAERESESLLATAGPADALALIRGWPHVLDGARQLLEAIPLRASDAGDDVNNPQHLTTRVIGMQRQTDRFRPVSAAPHPSMTDAAHNLDEAADLIRRLAPKHLITAAAQGDANAVRVRVARTLANLAHVTGREIRTYSAVVDAADRANAGGRDLAKTLSSRSTDQWLQTVQRHEEMVLGYVNTHRRQLHNEQHAAPFPPSSLGMQLAAWSTTAIRRVSDPQVGANDLRRVAQIEAWVLRVAAGFTAIAGIRGELEPAAVPHIQRRLEEASGQWATVHSQWRLIQTPDRRNDADRTVLSAARALATTVESVTASVDGWRTPAQINAQLAGTSIPPLLRTITEGSGSWPRPTPSCPTNSPQPAGSRRRRSPCSRSPVATRTWPLRPPAFPGTSKASTGPANHSALSTSPATVCTHPAEPRSPSCAPPVPPSTRPPTPPTPRSSSTSNTTPAAARPDGYAADTPPPRGSTRPCQPGHHPLTGPPGFTA